MRKPIEVIVLGTIEMTELPHLEPTDCVVWFSRTVSGRVHGVVGVSSRQIDVVVVDEFLSPRDGYVQVVEVSHKIGKFDGSTRIRISLRVLPEHQSRHLRPVTLEISPSDIVPCRVSVRDRYVDKSTLWEQHFVRYSHTLEDPARASDILIWHWKHYYRFLVWADVQDLPLEFGEGAIGLTLSAANRLASRMLYQRAREQGWRKLTLREQSRWGLSGQWHRDDDCVAARARLGHPSGVGEYTRAAASGVALEHPPTKWDDWEEL